MWEKNKRIRSLTFGIPALSIAWALGQDHDRLLADSL